MDKRRRLRVIIRGRYFRAGWRRTLSVKPLIVLMFVRFERLGQ